jgi:glycerol kinase
MRYQLALDQSTSSTKVLIYDRSGSMMDQESIKHAQIYPAPGWVEHDAEEIWQNLRKGVSNLLQRNPDITGFIDFVSITNQRETFVLFEKSTGKPVHHALVWMCTRSESICQRLKATPEGKLIKAHTGLEVDPYFSATKLKWIFDNKPESKAKVLSGEVLFGTIDTYLIYRMTQGAIYATDHTNASRTMFYNVDTRTWDKEVCSIFEMPVERLPLILDCNASYGPTTFDGILHTPLWIFGVMGDSQAALFAQRCFEIGSSKVTLGTGSSLLYNIGPKNLHSKNGIVTTLASVIKGIPTYSFEGVIRFSSGTMDWLKDQLGLFDDILEAEELANSIPDTEGVYLVPAFSGLGAPYWIADARAAVVGLTTQSDRRHIIRAGFESMGYQVKDVLDLLETESDQSCEILNVDGAPSSSPFLMQMLADFLQKPIRVSLTKNCSAFGAMLAGMLGAGIHDSLEDLQQIPSPHHHYKPTADPEVTTKKYQGWRKAVRAVKKN